MFFLSHQQFARTFTSCIVLVLAATQVLGQSDDPQQTEVLIPLNPNSKIQADNELIKLQKQKLRLEIEYLTRQLQKMNRDDDMPEEGDSLQPDENSQLPAGKLDQDSGNDPIVVDNPPITRDQAPHQGDVNPDLGADMLVKHLKHEQDQLLHVLNNFSTYETALQQELRQLRLQQTALEKEINFVEEQQQAEPSTTRVTMLETLKEKLATTRQSIDEASSSLAAFDDTQKQLMVYENKVRYTVTQVEQLKTRLREIEAFRSNVQKYMNN